MKNSIRFFLARSLATVFRMLSKPHPLEKGLCLIFSPHADDETLGCGGLISIRCRQGLPTTVVYVTDSAGTSPDSLERETLSGKRSQEALAALRVLGLDIRQAHFLKAPDGHLPRLTVEEEARLRTGLTALVRQLNPAAVYVPFKGSHSSEHEAAHDHILRGLQEADWQGQLWEYPVWAWWNPLRFARCALRKPAPQCLILEGQLLDKQLALRQHVSQYQQGSGLPAILERLCLGPWEFFFPLILPPKS